MHACSLKPTLYLRFHLENLNVLLRLQRVDGAVIDPIWNNYDKFSVKIPSYLHEVLENV